jgi:putative DNA methylase
MAGREILTRGNLPHWYVPAAAHFVTYRLAGTLLRQFIEKLQARKDKLLARPLPEGMPAVERRRLVHKQLFAEYDAYLDADRSVDWLTKPALAALIRGNLYHHNATKYHWLAFCIMPNHVRVLLQPSPDEAACSVNQPVNEAARFVNAAVDEAARVVNEPEEPCGEHPDSLSPLTGIMHSLKSYTAHEANKRLGRSGQFWQHESYDHWVRDEEELERIVDYINQNPVKAGLVSRAHEWFWGSAHDRFLSDGDTSGFLPPIHGAARFGRP